MPLRLSLLLCTLLLPLAGMAQAPQPAPVADSNTAPAVTPAAEAANAGLDPGAAAPPAPPSEILSPSEQYRRDLVNLLALRTDPQLLLAAAVMAEPDDGDTARAHALQPATLLARAQAAGPTDALVWWVSAFSCSNALHICPRPEALQKLVAAAPDNAAGWVMLAARAQQTGDVAGANANLARAAQARDFNDYSTELTRTLLQAIGDLPIPPDLLKSPPPGVAATAEGVRLTIAYNLAARLGPGSKPAVAATLDLCDPAGKAVPYEQRRASCSTLAAKLDWSSSLLAQRAGLALKQKIQGGKGNADSHTRERNLAWQQQQSGDIMQALLASPAGTRTLQRLSLQSHTEAGLVFALLREARVPLEAPLETPPDAADTVPAGQG